MKKGKEKLIVEGKRLDGRDMLDFRKVGMDLDVVTRADGSSQVSFGDTTAVASVYGPRKLYPRYLQKSDRGVLRYRYHMAPFSVDERKRPAPSRRSKEISKVSRIALEPSIFLEEFPKVVIDVFVEIVQADGSTRVTGINAASLALAIAGVPMRDLVAACSVGKIDGELVVDLNGIEDNNCEADVSFAMIPRKRKITLLQMDGLLTKDELKTLLKMAEEACEKVYEMQRDALKQKYKEVEV